MEKLEQLIAARRAALLREQMQLSKRLLDEIKRERFALLKGGPAND